MVREESDGVPDQISLSDYVPKEENETAVSVPSHQRMKNPSGSAPFRVEEDSSSDEEMDADDEEEDEALDISIGEKELPEDLPPSFLLSVDYSSKHNKAVLRLYEPKSRKVYFWIDNTGHKPYFYTDLPIQEAESRVKKNPGFVDAKKVKLHDLLKDRVVEMTKVIGDNPLSVGGRADSMRNYFVDANDVSHAWEANIRYRLTYTYDTELVPGLMYKIVKGALVPCPPDVDAKTLRAFKETLGDEEGLESILETYSPMFFTEVPDIRRLAVDIEVYAPVSNQVPDPRAARQPVTAIGLSDSDGMNQCFVLKRKGHPEGAKGKDYPKDLDIVYFYDEAEMLVEAFRIIDEYPIVLTFVGDSFDLMYLHERAKHLRIDMDQYCPITIRGANEPRRQQSLLDRGIHVDMYKFFSNPSIKIYALSGAYQRENLETIAQGILGEGKLDLSSDIAKLPYYELAHYCWRDANLVLRFTQFDDNVLLRLIVLLMRISRMSMDEVTRFYISSWIQSLFRQEHRSRDLIIPRRIDIDSMKQTDAQTAAMIDGKSFQGAIVIDPVPGVHFNATVLDFASLYPTIMKTHNISYETVDCPHEACKNATGNKVPETEHWTCIKRRGMVSQTIGFFRDTRVKWFKPKSKDKSLDERTRNWYSVVEKALKVFVNACLPYDEEVVVRNSYGLVSKRPIGSLENEWRELDILSIDNTWGSPAFGKPVFVPIVGFRNSGRAPLLDIRLRDGRTIRCTSNHVFPRLLPNHKRSHRKAISKQPPAIEYVAAEDLQKNDEILVLDDILALLGALGRHASMHHDEAVYRVVETEGLKYRRTGRGLFDFNGTRAVRIRLIEQIDDSEETYDLETKNGLFVGTNGIVVHNSYGVTGAQHFELFCMPAAESVTAYGRHAIKRTKAKSEEMGIRVLYGDTDSVFLDNPSKAQQEELVRWSREELGIDLEVEKTYKYVALSDRKKNYIGVYDDGRVDVKGLSGKKRNTPDFAQDAFRQMLEVLSRVNSPEGFEEAKHEIREIVNCVIDRLEGKADPYSPEELAFRMQITKPLNSYGTDVQHVRAGKMLVEWSHDPNKVPPGTIVEFIKTKDKDGILPVEMAREHQYFIDKDHYIGILRSVFEQVLDSVGLDFDEFLGFTTLDQFF